MSSKKKATALIEQLKDRKRVHLDRNNMNPNKKALAAELDEVIGLIREAFGIEKPQSAREESYKEGMRDELY